MPEFLSPGVFIEEVDAGPKPIEGVSTSTAGAAGVTTFGPTSGKPVLVTSFAEFVRIFGPPVAEPTGALFNQWALNPQEGGRWWQFALSIKGFFDNGGQRIFVKRVFSKAGARAAKVEFGHGLVSEIEADAGAQDTSLKLRHLIGISRFNDVSVFDPALVGTFKVLSYDAVSRTIRLDRRLDKALQAGKSFVEIRPRQPQEKTLTVRAKALGIWGNDLRAQVRPMVGTTASLLADPDTFGTAFKTSAASSELTWVIELADATGLAALTKVEIKGKPVDISHPDETMRTFEVQGKPPADIFDATEGLGEKQLMLATVSETVNPNTSLIKFVEGVSEVKIGDRLQVKGKGFVVIAKPTGGLTVRPPFGAGVAIGDKVKVLRPDPALGEKLLIGVGTATITTAAPTPTDTIKLNTAEVSNLVVGDRIKVGNKVHVVTEKLSTAGEFKVEPQFTAQASAEVKLFKVLVSAGTRRNMTLTDPSALNDTNNNHFIFLPTGKEFTVADVTGDTIQFNPAIPLGFDWVSRKIEYTAADTQVKGTQPAGATLLIKNISLLKKGDAVTIGTSPDKHVLTADPTPATTDPASGTIKATPEFPDTTDGAAVHKIIQTTVADNTADWKLEVDNASGLKPQDHVLIKGEEIVIDGISGKVLSLSVQHDSGGPWPTGTPVSLLRSATNTTDRSIVQVSGASQLYKGAIVEIDNGTQKEVATIESIDGDKVKLSKNLEGSYLEGHKLRVVEAEIQARQVVNNRVVLEESFTNLRLVDDKTSSFFVTAVKNSSSLIEIADPLGPAFPDTPGELSVLANFPTSANGGLDPLADGADGLDQLTVDDFVGVDDGSGKRTGIQALEDIDEISICLAPNVWSPTVHSALILHCETLKDRFAILDPKDGLSIEQIRDVRENLDSKYAALYYPWLEVRDPIIGRNVQVAPSGHMAGIYARVDVERGVHKAPANEIIRGITKIADEVTKREQDLLNPKGINALRFFPGRGNRVWGTRTISSDSSWRYINVRRLFLFVEESIDEGTQFVVFEPNSDPTWARVRQTITNFLTTVWRSGALEGTTADQAFFVKCDRTTMSQDDIDNGRLICVIGIAPVKPAEFVIFKIQQLVRTSNPT